jgi:integrase
VSADGYLFPGRYGAGLSADVVGRTLSRLLGPGWSGHTIRHRFASSAYAAERDLRAVQELLGHSKPETTARYVQTPTHAKHAAVLAAGLSFSEAS